jgi:hypothetical protein
MHFERSARKPGFVEGVAVRLSDGGVWSLPLRDPDRPEPEYDTLLAVVCEAENRTEGLRAELALTIHLLDRNYDLSGDELAALLSFPPGDPDLAELQDEVHGLVLESLRRLRQAREVGTRTEDPRSPRRRGAVSPPSSRSQSLGTLGIP